MRAGPFEGGRSGGSEGLPPVEVAAAERPCDLVRAVVEDVGVAVGGVTGPRVAGDDGLVVVDRQAAGRGVAALPGLALVVGPLQQRAPDVEVVAVDAAGLLVDVDVRIQRRRRERLTRDLWRDVLPGLVPVVGGVDLGPRLADEVVEGGGGVEGVAGLGDADRRLGGLAADVGRRQPQRLGVPHRRVGVQRRRGSGGGLARRDREAGRVARRPVHDAVATPDVTEERAGSSRPLS